MTERSFAEKVGGQVTGAGTGMDAALVQETLAGSGTTASTTESAPPSTVINPYDEKGALPPLPTPDELFRTLGHLGRAGIVVPPDMSGAPE